MLLGDLKKPVEHKEGYLFNFKRFVDMLVQVAKVILKEPVTKLLERIELSEGLL